MTQAKLRPITRGTTWPTGSLPRQSPVHRMAITRDNLAAHELIGLNARVTHASSRKLAGTNGRIVDETRRTLAIETARGVKTVPKNGTRLDVRLPHGEKVALDATRLEMRPADRAKRLLGRK